MPSSCCCPFHRGQNRPLHKQDGPWSWLVLVSTFLQSWLIIGMMRSFGIFLPVLMDEFNEGRDKIALIGSLGNGSGFLFTMFTAWLNTIIQSRIVTGIGHVLLISAYGLSSAVYRMEVMYFTYSILFGIGLSFILSTHVLIIFRYFQKHRSLAQGVNTAGGALGIMSVPALVQYLVGEIGWRNTFRIASGCLALSSLLCIVFSPHVERLVHEVDAERQKEAHNDGVDTTGVGSTQISATQSVDEITCANGSCTYAETDDTNEHDSHKCAADQENPTGSDIQQCIAHQDNPPIKHDIKQCTADQENRTLEHDNQQCTADQENRTLEHGNQQCAAGQDNPTFEHDIQQCAAGQDNISNDNETQCNNELEQQAERHDSNNNTAQNNKSTKCRGLFDFSVWRNPKFVITTASICIGTFAIFSPSIHLIKFSEEIGVSALKASTLYTFVGITSLIARIVSGKLCDIAWINPNMVIVTAVLLASLDTFMFTLSSSYIHLVIFASILGLADGIFRTASVVAIMTSVETSKAGTAFGQGYSAFALFSIGGPAITGLLADMYGRYTIAYYMNGCVLIGAAAIHLIPMSLKLCKKSSDFTLEHVEMTIVHENSSNTSHKQDTVKTSHVNPSYVNDNI